MYPAYLGILIITAAMALPFHFFNKYLVKVTRPRESGRRLLLYFFTVLASAFVYMAISVYVFVGIFHKFK